jgi:hypothetical protein
VGSTAPDRQIPCALVYHGDLCKVGTAIVVPALKDVCKKKKIRDTSITTECAQMGKLYLPSLIQWCSVEELGKSFSRRASFRANLSVGNFDLKTVCTTGPHTTFPAPWGLPPFFEGML